MERQHGISEWTILLRTYGPPVSMALRPRKPGGPRSRSRPFTALSTERHNGCRCRKHADLQCGWVHSQRTPDPAAHRARPLEKDADAVRISLRETDLADQATRDASFSPAGQSRRAGQPGCEVLVFRDLLEGGEVVRHRWSHVEVMRVGSLVEGDEWTQRRKRYLV